MHGRQANWVPYGPPNGSPMMLFPGNLDQSTLSPAYVSTVGDDNIALKVGGYGLGLGHPQKTNFAPRFGFAYQVTPKLVARGGFGIFYNAFENQGYGPNDGENYPFVFNFNWNATNDCTPLARIQSENPNPWTGCPTAGPGRSSDLVVRILLYQLLSSCSQSSRIGLAGTFLQFQDSLRLEQ